MFGSEELGLIGSQHYVSTLTPEEVQRTLVMLNYDSVGSGDLEIGGNPLVAQSVAEIARAQGIVIGVAEALPGSSDHVPFGLAGIPPVVLYGTDFSRIHTPDDTRDWVDAELLARAALVAIHGLLGGFDGLAE